MLNEQIVYSELLDSFSDSLAETSKDHSGTSACFMTSCQTQVVNFDSFKESLVKKGWSACPKSCDALHRHSKDTWFLIEFKNGIIENSKGPSFKPQVGEFFDIIRKFFESLFLLTDKLNQTIEFTRNTLYFILVYNEDKNSYLRIKDSITKLGHKKETIPVSHLFEILPDEPFSCSYFEELYVKKAYICSKETFERVFVGQFL